MGRFSFPAGDTPYRCHRSTAPPNSDGPLLTWVACSVCIRDFRLIERCSRTACYGKSRAGSGSFRGRTCKRPLSSSSLDELEMSSTHGFQGSVAVIHWVVTAVVIRIIMITDLLNLKFGIKHKSGAGEFHGFLGVKIHQYGGRGVVIQVGLHR